MRNKQVIEAFLDKRRASGSNLYSDGNKLINYNTSLAEWYNDNYLIVNTTKYSVSTSRIQNMLRQAILSRNYIIPLPIENISMGTKDLISEYEFSKRGI